MQLPPLPAFPAGSPPETSRAGRAPLAATDPKEIAARKAAEDFEAAFLAEMLKESGINAMPSGFGGGAGEEAFGSFLTEEYARLLAQRGGFGLAERVFEILKQR